MSELTLLLIAVYYGIATARLSSLLVNEDGPYEAFAKLRYLFGIRYDVYGNPYSERELGKLFLCAWCISIWVGIALVLLHFISDLTLWLVMPFVISEVSIAFREIVK